ncbi:DUF7309 domain-containing protein [Cellulosilyticum ruminicola]|uniref:DUF7309 domain-containing protein n=1 Tax=Cellulosilyticum ruminicola TaxID=425254 RepID=UPI0006D2142C|nr:hypothetical protein [Cellulosilyticum ruminicola]
MPRRTVKNEINVEELKKLFENVVAYKKAKPWEKMSEEQVFAVEDPETHEVGWCSIIGEMGEHISLNVYLGEAGKQAIFDFHTIKANEIHSRLMAIKHIFSQAALACSFEDKDFLEERDLAVLRLLDLRFRGKNAWPVCREFRPGKKERQIKDGWNSRFLSYALTQATQVAKDVKAGRLVIEPITEAKQILYIYTETIDGEAITRRSWRPFDFEKEMNCIRPYIFSNDMLIKGIKRLKKSNAVISCKQFVLPVRVKGEDDIYYPSNMLFYDHKLEKIEHMSIVGDVETEGQFSRRGPHLLKQYAEHMISIGERPKEIVVDEEATYQLFADFCKKTGIILRKGEVESIISEIVEEMIMEISEFNDFNGNDEMSLDEFNEYLEDYEDIESDEEFMDQMIEGFIVTSINDFLGRAPRYKWTNEEKDRCGNTLAEVISALWQVAGEGPGMWTPEGMKQILTQVIPLGHEEGLKALEQLPQDLIDYLKLIDQQARLTKSKALIKAVEDSKEVMINNYKARNLFGTNNKVIPFKR